MSFEVDSMHLNTNNDDGMVPLNPYVPSKPNNDVNLPPPLSPPVDDKLSEKNINNNQIEMDSTPIADLMGNETPGGMSMMMEPPAMSEQPRMQSMTMTAPQPVQPVMQERSEQPPKQQNNNPFNLTDDQMEALIVGVCAAIAISKPVQEKLSTTIPRFTNDMGGRSAIGLASTGLFAAVVYFILQRYVLKK